MQKLYQDYQSLNFHLSKIQNLIKTFQHDSVNLNDKEKSIHVAYDKRLDLFVMDSLTRCLNIKKSSDFDQVTTHCACYFKLNVSFDSKNSNIKMVSKLIITSNKNADKLRQRCSDLFSLIGYEIDDKNEKCFLRKVNTQGEFLDAINFKFANLNKSLNYYLKNLNKDINVEFNSNGKEVFEKWIEYLKNIECINLDEFDEKTKNAVRDTALFYFYLSVFYYFIKDFYCFDNTELVILDPNRTPLYGLHCEMQLISKYLNEIDENNKYISISSDCCVLCSLVLKNLGLNYYGAKNNMCSSRFWKQPRFDREVKKYQFDRLHNFYINLNQELKSVYILLKENKFTEENKEYTDEIPYSDEWIDNQYDFWKQLLKKKIKRCIKDLKNKIEDENQMLSIIDEYRIYFSNELVDYFSSKMRSILKEKNLKKKFFEIIKLDKNYRINSVIESYSIMERKANQSKKRKSEKTGDSKNDFNKRKKNEQDVK